MGTTDGNGVYKYAETDSASTFSALLNTGQNSVSAAIGAVKTSTNSRLTALESAPVLTAPMLAGWTASSLKVIRQGSMVFIAGRIFKDGVIPPGSYAIGNLPAGITPPPTGGAQRSLTGYIAGHSTPYEVRGQLIVSETGAISLYVPTNLTSAWAEMAYPA